MSSPLRPVESQADLEAELAHLVRDRSLLLVGGADFASADLAIVGGIRAFLLTLAMHCDATGTAVVDGGTDAGVMRWFADARAAIGGTFPLVGVAPRFAFERTTGEGRPITVAPGHAVVLAVPGEHFGEEMPWLFAAVDHLGSNRPAPTILVNGGDLAATEARMRLASGQLVVVVAGSGRAADALATEAVPVGSDAAGFGAAGSDVPGSGRLRVISLAADEATLAAALQEGPTA
jgi:hypothetical protein